MAFLGLATGLCLQFWHAWLIGHWFPRLWLHWVAREKAFKELSRGYIVIEVRHAVR